MTNNQLCLDTNFLVGLFDRADVWHRNSLEIFSYLGGRQLQIVYFDCVLNELYSVLARRCRERGEVSDFPRLAARVNQAIPIVAITWLYPQVPRWYEHCLSVMEDTQGRLNFHDALIAVAMQELQLSGVVSFDAGFDQVPRISRLDSPDKVAAWLEE